MIDLSIDAYKQVIAHAREGAPREVCGVLGGERETRAENDERAERDSIASVRSVHRATNVARSPRRTYLIDAEEQFEIMEAIEERGREVVGFYHSHPSGPPFPSPVDERRAAWPGYSYVICVPRIPFVGSWRWHGSEKRFEPEALTLR